MSRTRIAALLLATLAAFLPSLAPVALAGPCAGACGVVTLLTDCETFVRVSAWGAFAAAGTVWTFVVRESAAAWSHTTTATTTGPSASFEYHGTALSASSFEVDAALYADGRLVDRASWACA